MMAQEEDKMADEPAPAAQPNPLQSCQGPSGFIFVISFAFLFLIMFDRDLGNQISSIVGVVLYPVIGFGGRYPIFTMLGAGILTITISTGVRHFTMDWIDLAKKQRLMNEYNKAVRKATKEGNQSLVERLQAENQDIMGMQSSMMMQQMKASIISKGGIGPPPLLLLILPIPSPAMPQPIDLRLQELQH